MQKFNARFNRTLISALRSVLISNVTVHGAAGMPRRAARVQTLDPARSAQPEIAGAMSRRRHWFCRTRGMG
jgi:hypothetical protein